MGSTLTNLVYHVIFSTKNREPMINPTLCKALYGYIGGIVKGENATLLQIGGMPDHIHIVLKLKPVHSLSEIMQKLKGSSSKWVNEQGCLKERFSWQEGYGAFTVSESQVAAVVHYVKNQEKHHRNLSFKDEFTQFLERHKVEYDERYVYT